MSFRLKSVAVDSQHEISDLCRYFSELSPQPMVVVEGLTHVVRYLNPAFCRLADRKSSDLIGRPFCEAVPEGKSNDCLALLDRVHRTGESEILAEQEHLNSPASYWSYSCWPILGADKRPTGVMIQITDTTENVTFRKRLAEMNGSLIVSSMRQHEITETAEKLNEELQIATQVKNQFLASMSHEIRTPLNAIMGFSELLSLPNQSVSDRKNYGDRIKRQGGLLLRLIDDILDLSKVEAGRLDVEKIEVALPELMSDIQLVMQHLAEEKGIAFSMTAESPLPGTILCDPTRLKQILTNIIGNAIKFTTIGSVTVMTKVDRAHKKLHFEVRDTGDGMTAEQASRVFQPFTQAESATTRKFGGTGLGLDLARRLAHALGGDVVLVDTTPGIGSVFKITIALEGDSCLASPAPSLKPRNEKRIRLDGVKVLLAEDGPDNQFLVSKFLSLAGAHVDMAADGEEAVSMALEEDYDIILMDIQMPNLNGFQATMRLRTLGCKVPVVALTAHAMPSEIEKCYLAGCDAHLSKPLGMQKLLDTVHRMLYDRPTNSTQADAFQDSANT